MIHIITDTTAALPKDLAERYHIPVIPQVVLFGEESYLEEVELSTGEFMRRLQAAKSLPKTAAPPPGLFIEAFRERVGPDKTIICIHPSSDLSGTVRSALTAKEEFPQADIRVVDTRTIAGPLATMVVMAAEWAQAGVDADTIIARLEALIPRTHIFFLVATLEYLQKGGRIGGAQALIGSLLQVKPLLELRDGRVETLERERTHRRALARLKELVVARAPHGPEAHVSVMHAEAADVAQELAANLAAQLGIEEPPITNLPPAIVTHAGPGMLGVGFFS